MFTPKIRHSSIDSRPRRTYLAALLAIIGLLAALNATPAFAMPRDPIDPPDIGEPNAPFVPPADGFDWSVPARFGRDDNHDSMIDYYWNDSNDPEQPNTYEDTHVYPDDWPINLDGCRTRAEEENGSSSDVYVWHIHGQGALEGYTYESPVADHRCRLQQDLPAQGNYTVQLAIYDPTGVKIAPPDERLAYEQPVYIKDYLIVSIGDSFASGEANPDIPRQASWSGTARWQDERCHRSAIAGPAQAALTIERNDRHTSVTFLSFACSGATVGNPLYDPILLDWVPPFIFLEPDEDKPRGTGILGRYRGQQVPATLGYPADNSQLETYGAYIPSQIDQLRTALTPPDARPPRAPDALIMSGGGNDIYFGDIAQACVLTWDCFQNANMFESPGSGGWTIDTLVKRALGYAVGSPDTNLKASYQRLSDALNSLTVNDVNVKPRHIYITEYPDMSRDDNGNFCRMLDDIWWPNPLWVIEDFEAEDAMGVLRSLNSTVLYAAGRYGWTYVDGMMSYLDDPDRPVPLVRGPDGRGHGYCATENWIRRAEEAVDLQGPAARFQTTGTLHPAAQAHQIYKERILHYMAPDLAAQLVTNPPQFQVSFTVNALTSFATRNGWFIKSCTEPGGTGTCEDKVVLKVTANADQNTAATLRGAASTVNGLVGCPTGAVCTGPELSNSNKTATWTYALAVDGIYQFNFTAQDCDGQTASFVYQVKADLHDPQLTMPALVTVNEGGSVVLQAQASDAGGGVVDVDWDLNNDTRFEMKDEQATFSAAAIDGPAERMVVVRAKDAAGRVVTATTTVSVLNVAPTLSNLARSSATVNEGGSVTLTGNISDPASADYFSLEINWGDGSAVQTVNWPAGTTFFSAAHTFADDKPTATASDLNTISVRLSDDNGASANGMTTVTVNNLAPAVGTIGGLNLVLRSSAAAPSLPFNDAGTGDTHSVVWDWGDGTTGAGTVQEANGSGTVRGSHVYAQRGVYVVKATVSDDDGGKAMATHRYAVIYDSTSGIAAGSGWIDSPAGAYVANPAATGQANFGFVCQRQTGALPVGVTVFELPAAGLSFRSTSYSSLSFTLTGAGFKGEGTINGTGKYSFEVTVVIILDPDGGDTETFRIKIWDKVSGAIVYDNRPGTTPGDGSVLMIRR